VTSYAFNEDTASGTQGLDVAGLRPLTAPVPQPLGGPVAIGFWGCFIAGAGALVARAIAAVAAFTRIQQDRALGHERRDRIVRLLEATPGRSFSDVKRTLGLTNGVIVHHLRILEAQGLVCRRREGKRVRLYAGPAPPPDTPYLTQVQQRLLRAVAGRPGAVQRELIQGTGLARSTASYHLRHLAVAGMVVWRRRGKWKTYWPAHAGDPPAGL
jgi:predicted transcriptional regulator